MSLVIGYGGSVTWVRLGGNVTLCIGVWTFTRKVEIEKKAHAGSGGVKVPIVGDRDYSGTIELPFDDGFLLERNGFYEGVGVRLRLKIGASTKIFDLLAVVESLVYKVDNGSGAVMISVAWQGASLPLGPK